MVRVSVGVVIGLAIVFFLGLIVLGNAAMQGMGGAPIDFSALPDPVERFGGGLFTTSHSMMVTYNHTLFIPVIVGSPSTAKILKYVPGPDGTKGVLSEFLVDPTTGKRYDYLGVHGGALYITHTNGSVFKYDGSEMTLLPGTPFTANGDFVTSIAEFKGKVYFGTDQGRIYRESYGLYNQVSSAGSKIYGIGIWNDLIYATSAGTNPYPPNWMTSIQFSDTGNENEWTVDWINGQIEYLCGSTNDYVTLYDHQTDPGGDRVLRTRDMPHFSIVNQSNNEYKQHHDSFLFDGVEYIFANSEWSGDRQGYGRLVMIDDLDTTTIEMLPKLIIACEVVDNYVYIVTPVIPGTQNNLHAVALDHEAPVVTSDSTPSKANTGGVLAFEVAVTDNFDVGSFFVEHWTDSSPTHVKEPMSLRSGTTHEGMWAMSIPVALDSIETIHYAFDVTDTTSNLLVTPNKDVEVQDDRPPTFQGDHSSTSGVAGRPFTFSTDVTDNIGVTEVHVEYWCGTGARTNLTLTGTGTYTVTTDLSSSSAGQMSYIFTATDAAGNWNQTTVRNVMVTDMDAPTFGNGTSPFEGTTGDSITLGLEWMHDNIAISSAHLEYWVGSGAHVNKTLPAQGPYVADIDIPSDATSITYFFSAVDAAGNWGSTSPRTIPIRDNDPPILGGDGSDLTAIVGRPYAFKVDVSDNIALKAVKVEHWFGQGTHQNQSMLGGPPSYTLEIDLLITETRMLSYFFFAEDESNNAVVSSTFTRTPTGLERLSFDVDGSDAAIVAGTAFKFVAKWLGNIGVSEARVSYWFDAGTPSNFSMALDGDAYTYSFTVPASAKGTLRYQFKAKDPTGSWAVSTEFTRTLEDRARPSFGSDGSDGTAAAGKDFKFVAGWSDDVGVTAAFVEYWFDGQTPVNVSMALAAGKYTLTLNIPGDAKGKLHYEFKARDAAGNWAASSELGLDVTQAEKPAEEKSALLLPAIAAIVIIVVVVALLLVMMRSRRGRAPVTAPMAPIDTGPEHAGGMVGGAALAGTAIGAPPAAPIAPATPAPPVPTGAPGKFMVINIKTQCAACGGMMERGTNAYVCSCGMAIHEQCAGRLKMCPSCRRGVNFG